MMEKDYTKQAQMLAKQYARNFHGPSYSLDDGEANFSLDEASRLIAVAQKEKYESLKAKANKEVLAQQRSAVGLLPDRDAERLLEELNKPEQDYVADAKQQAEHYAISRNKKGTTPRSTQGVDPSITEGVISWIERQRARGHWKKN
jgi:hypothetical protein